MELNWYVYAIRHFCSDGAARTRVVSNSRLAYVRVENATEKTRDPDHDAKEPQRRVHLSREGASCLGCPEEPAAAEPVGGLGDLFGSAYYSPEPRLEIRDRFQTVVGTYS